MFVYLFAFVLFIILYWIVNSKKDPRLPPGVHGWPIVGSFPSFKIPLEKQVEKYRQKFGDVFLWRVGSQTIVYICDPKMIRKAFNNPHLSDRPQKLFSFDSWTYFSKIGIINNNGLSWLSHRRLALRSLKDSGLGKDRVEAIIQFEAEELIKKIERDHLNAPLMPPPAINVATVNVIWKLTADIRFEEDHEDIKNFMSSLIQMNEKVQGLINIFDVFPWLVPFTPKFVMDKIQFTELQDIREKVKDYLKTVVEKRRASLVRENPNGLIDAYLLELENNTNDAKEFTEDGLIVSLGDLFIAGSDTTATTIKWTLQLMASNPEIQTRIQREIDSVVPRDRQPSLADKSRLPLTEASIHEALRIALLVPFGLYHAASQDTTIDEYFIPKDTVVLPFVYRCHMDPSYWEKPNEFYPQHFLDSEGKFSNTNEAFMPFSTGRRVCLGENLARSEIFVFVTSLLQKFSFEMADKKQDVNEKHPGSIFFNMPPKVEVIIRKRA